MFVGWWLVEDCAVLYCAVLCCAILYSRDCEKEEECRIA